MNLPPPSDNYVEPPFPPLPTTYEPYTTIAAFLAVIIITLAAIILSLPPDGWRRNQVDKVLTKTRLFTNEGVARV